MRGFKREGIFMLFGADWFRGGERVLVEVGGGNNG